MATMAQPDQTIEGPDAARAGSVPDETLVGEPRHPPSRPSPPADPNATLQPPPQADDPISATLMQDSGEVREALARAEQRRQNVFLPQIPGFQILEELGRGGMGVVYKVRQLSLKRVVALKRILPGNQVDAADLARFRTEAEAIARLQHPNIVQIYEIGEHQGLPYFSLEYCGGGNLKTLLDDAPFTPMQAARCVETLARAMAVAHRERIIHRDLKPQNVLRTEAGAFKIGDFGLAKKLDDDSSMTRAGAVMGTPSYMAPEQARGEVEQVGVLADVYALGAILYETLTGHPPFRSATTVETLLQVIQQEPVPPRALQPKTPRDLETICLKCLHKDPAQRYASAEELAEELSRFQQGLQIVARPAGVLVRTWKWSRRHPTAVALLATIVLGLLTLVGVVAAYNVSLREERDEANNQRANAETQRIQAEKNLDEATKQRLRANANLARALAAVDQMLTEVAEGQLATEPRMEEKRKALLDKALQFYQAFFREGQSDPKLRVEVAAAHLRYGDVLRWLSKDQDALKQYAAALDHFGPTPPDPVRQPELVHKLARVHIGRGESLRMVRQSTEAMAAQKQARDLLADLCQRWPDEATYATDLALSHNNLGILHAKAGEWALAEAAYRDAVQLLEQLAKRSPDQAMCREEWARVLLNLGPVLRRREKLDEAGQAYRQAISLLEQLLKKTPSQPEVRYKMALAENNYSILLAQQNDPLRAETANAKARRLLEKLNEEFPRVSPYQMDLAIACNSSALTLNRKAAYSQAIEQALRAQDLLTQLVERHPANLEYQARLALATGTLAAGHIGKNKDEPDPENKRLRWELARGLLEESIRRLRQVIDQDPGLAIYQPSLTHQQSLLEEVNQALGLDR